MMMKSLLRAALTMSLLVSLAGCGYLFGDKGMFRDKSEDYKDAPEEAIIRVPEGKDREALKELYAIPEIQHDLVLAGDFEVPRPTPLVVGAADEIVRIQKLGAASWAVVEVAPGQVWPQVRGFLSAAGIQLAGMDARQGTMDTAFIEIEGQPISSRFRFRIEQGVQRGTSELHVLQMHRKEDQGYWPATSDNPEQEAEMLRSVAQFLANSADTAPVSMIANQSISASGKVSLQESPQGYTYISLGLTFDRAWASLSKALEVSNFDITDRDRSAGQLYVTFRGLDGEDEEGWFDWLFDEEDDPLTGQEFMVEMKALAENEMSIRMEPLNPLIGFDKRQEQGLLSLIKGNIH